MGETLSVSSCVVSVIALGFAALKMFSILCWDYQVLSIIVSPVFFENGSGIGFPMGLSNVSCLGSLVIWSC